MLNLDRHDFTEPWRPELMILGSSLPIIGLADVKERAVRIEMAVDAKSRFSRRRLRFRRERATSTSASIAAVYQSILSGAMCEGAQP
jgi:hypothetical protein